MYLMHDLMPCVSNEPKDVPSLRSVSLASSGPTMIALSLFPLTSPKSARAARLTKSSVEDAPWQSEIFGPRRHLLVLGRLEAALGQSGRLGDGVGPRGSVEGGRCG